MGTEPDQKPPLENLGHTVLDFGDGHGWKRYAKNAVAMAYGARPEGGMPTMMVEEIYDFDAQNKRTFYTDLKTNKVAKLEEKFDPLYGVESVYGGQFSPLDAKEMLATFDRVNAQIAFGQKLGQGFLTENVSYRVSPDNCAVWMLESDKRMNRILHSSDAQDMAGKAIVETFDFATAQKTVAIYDIATAKPEGPVPDLLVKKKMLSQIPEEIIPRMHAQMLADHRMEVKRLTEMEAAAKAAEPAPAAAVEESKKPVYEHPKDDPKPHEAPPGSGAQQKRHSRKTPPRHG